VPAQREGNRTESESEKEKKEEEVEESVEPKGDPEMAPVYLRHLLPVFTQVCQQGSMQQTIKKASLALIRKMVHYIPAPLLEEMCRPLDVSAPPSTTDEQKQGAAAAAASRVSAAVLSGLFTVQLVEVLALVLDTEVSTGVFF
jgi:hypothetical protein